MQLQLHFLFLGHTIIVTLQFIHDCSPCSGSLKPSTMPAFQSIWKLWSLFADELTRASIQENWPEWHKISEAGIQTLDSRPLSLQGESYLCLLHSIISNTYENWQWGLHELQESMTQHLIINTGSWDPGLGMLTSIKGKPSYRHRLPVNVSLQQQHTVGSDRIICSCPCLIRMPSNCRGFPALLSFQADATRALWVKLRLCFCACW